MAPTFTSPTNGTCSFCGKDRRETRAFVGSSITDVRICDGCLGLCCSVMAEMAGAKEEVEDQSAVDFSEDRLASVLTTLAKKGPRATAPTDPDFRCSFCDHRRADVAALISGPLVFICDACVGGAVAVVKRESRAG